MCLYCVSELPHHFLKQNWGHPARWSDPPTPLLGTCPHFFCDPAHIIYSIYFSFFFLDNIEFLQVVAESKPTNTWTSLSEVEINAGFQIQKLNVSNNKWESVLPDDNVAPCSNILNSFFEQITGMCLWKYNLLWILIL